MNASDNLGQQAKSIAEATNTAVDAVGKLGTFVDNVFGNAIKNGLGIVGDKLAYYRLERAIEFQSKVEKRLKAKGIDVKKYVPVSFGLPILEKASVEENEELQTLWANLLANALDPKYVGALTRNFSTMLADIEPIDARILDVVVQEYSAQPEKERALSLFSLDLLHKNVGISREDCENSIRNLMRLGLFKPGIVEGGVTIGDHKLSAYKDTELFAVTGLGISFHHAVTS